MKLRSISFVLLATLACAGCRHTPAPSQSESTQAGGSQPAAAPPVDLATAGTITGVVHFDGKAPARIAIDMSADPACALSPTPNLTEQFVVDHGKLANVYVYIKAGVPASSAPPNTPPVAIDQKGCRYIPHVVAVQQGGSVEFLNSDPSTHNVHTIPTQPGNQSMDISQSPGAAPRIEHFKSAEIMLPVRCNNHPWMNAFINVAPNPYVAVTGSDGSFTIHGVPPGQYTLAAVHEKLGELDIPVTITAKSTTTAGFSFAAKP